MDADGLSGREQETICGYTRTSTLHDSGMFYIPVGQQAGFGIAGDDGLYRQLSDTGCSTGLVLFLV